MKNNLPSFEDRYDIICREIEKRRRGWTLAAVSFDDVKQNALIRISQQYNTKYDPRKDNVNRPEAETFLHWLNTVISNLIKNQLRDNLGKFSRPCLTERCVFNVGADSCSKNPSGIQCSECLAYRSWEERKLNHFNIKQTLPLENHFREADMIQDDTPVDYSKVKIIHEKMKGKLSKSDYELYTEIFILGKPEKEVGEAHGMKKVGNTYAGYQPLNRLRHKVVEIAKKIIEEENLA